jgi:hypothetical protein
VVVRAFWSIRSASARFAASRRGLKANKRNAERHKAGGAAQLRISLVLVCLGFGGDRKHELEQPHSQFGNTPAVQFRARGAPANCRRRSPAEWMRYGQSMVRALAGRNVC